MFVISKNKQRGAVLRDYEFLDGGVGKFGVTPDRIKINGVTFGEYECPEDYEDARNAFLEDLKHNVERIELL